uniref:Uncharacterized protein n=1 Tax=Arundo donax TaxID=35708 RepID=A0A0A9FPS1_ARUDO
MYNFSMSYFQARRENWPCCHSFYWFCLGYKFFKVVTCTYYRLGNMVDIS